MKNKAIILANIIFGLSTYFIVIIYLYAFVKAYSGIDPGASILMPVTVSVMCIIYFFIQLFNTRKYKLLMLLYFALIVLTVMLFLILLQIDAQSFESLNTIYHRIAAFFAMPGTTNLFGACVIISPIVHIISMASGIFATIYIRRQAVK